MTSDVSAASPIIVAFDEPLPAGVDAQALLGGKGANLARMTRVLDLPVPPGFTITTEVCRRYLAGGWPAGLDAALSSHLDRLGRRLGRKLGAPEAPLLVSVRSGAPVSMPGMLDTVLNVGMTVEIREALAAGGKPYFAADTWLRFCRMYAGVVLAIPAAELANAATSDDTPAGLLVAAERVRALAATAGGIPAEPLEQVRGAVAAVFRSWYSERARAFRAQEQISETLGTAVTIQAMVFGNRDERSGTGVAFTRNPATGDRGPYGDYLVGAQGEDVVAGTHAVHGLDLLQRQLPAAFAELLAALDRLERHYRDLCDVEFTVSGGTLYILQTRIGRRSPLAAVRIAVGMASDPDFPLTHAEAIARVDAPVLQQLAGRGSVREGATPLTTGIAASPGVGVGALCCDADRAAERTGEGIAVVLAREETSPSDIHGMAGAAGLVTTLGGVASHAAVVARGWAIPAVTSLANTCVLSAGLQIGDRFIAEGELITVDGTGGALYAGDQRAAGAADILELATLRTWAAELGIELGVAQSAQSEPTAAVQVESEPANPRASLALFDLVRTVQLKGLCTAEHAATVLSADSVRIEELFAANEGLFRSTPRGVVLTPDGRNWAGDQLAAERAACDSASLDACCEPFAKLNQRFKQLVSGWQLAPDSQTDAAWEALVESLAAIHIELRPLIARTAIQLARLAAYARRFDEALAAMRTGDRSMLATPLKDSYHTVWFEYHEELIALTGRDRSAEE